VRGGTEVDVGGFLKSFALDTWYKALMYAGALLFAVGLTVNVRGITNGEALLIGFGFFAIGLGEWKNHKVASWFKPPNVYTGPAAFMEAPVRKADALGLFLDFCGVVSLCIGVWHIAHRVLF
jgi:hypothetical protein